MRTYQTILAVGMCVLSVVASGQIAPAGRPSSAEIAQGRRLFIRCAACHAIAPTTQVKIGPNLQGVVGRRAGTLAGFNYSAAMRNSTIRWDDATLDRWLQRPQTVVPGTTMAFAGLSNPADRRALIAYLRRPN